MDKDASDGYLKFQGAMPYPPADRVDDWGFNVQQQESKVEQFRRMLEAQGLWRKDDHDYYTLLRFLRARNYEFEKAARMFADSLAWRREFSVDVILDDFVFHEREQFLMAYPQGYHKTDKLGRPVYIQLLGKIDINILKQITSEERMIKFHIQEYERCCRQIMPICSRLQGRQIDQTFGIMDVKGVGLSHLTGEVKRLMATLTKYDQDNYPEMLGRICIINAPMVFKALWGLVKPMLNPRTISKIQICQTNYSRDLLEWVDADNLPVWLGGRSKGTLLDDCGPWNDPEVLKRLDAEGVPMAHRLVKQLTVNVAASAGEAAPTGRSEAGEDADGFQSPRSEASFHSLPGPETTTPLLGHVAGTHGGDADAAAAATTAAGGAGAAPPHEADRLRRRSSGAEAETSAPRALLLPPGSGSPTLAERLARLEELYSQQVVRLKGYLPARSLAALQERNAPDGTLLQRIEVLEQGLELLLHAQDLQWQQQEAAAKATGSCGCCTIC